MNLKRLMRVKDSEDYSVKWYFLFESSVGFSYIEDEDYDYDDNFEEQKRVFELCKQDVVDAGGIIDDFYLDNNTYEDSSYIIFHCKDLKTLNDAMKSLVETGHNMTYCFAKPKWLSDKQWEKASYLKDGIVNPKEHVYEVGDIVYWMENHVPHRIWKITKVDENSCIYEMEACDSYYKKTSKSSFDIVDDRRNYKPYFELVEEEKTLYSESFADLKTLEEHLNNIGLYAKFDIKYPSSLLKVYDAKGGEHITTISSDKADDKYQGKLLVCFWGYQYSSPVYYEGNTTREIYFDFDVLMSLTKEQWLGLQEMTESEYYKLHGKKK